MKKRFLIPLLAVAAPLAIGIADAAIHNIGCGIGNQGACTELARRQQYSEELDANRKRSNEALAQAKADAEKQAAASKKRQAAAEAKIAEAKAQADAKFKAEGWFQLEPGIYGRWCTKTCSTAEVIGDQAYWLMEVWAKDRAAGDVYAQINIVRDGVIIGWTNDTAYIDHGQRAVLTFGKYGLNDPGQNQAQLVKFNARG